MKDDRQIAAESRDNFHFLPHFYSEVTERMFIKFLHDVVTLLSLLMGAYKRRYWIPFRNARAKSEGGQFRRLQKSPKKINWLP